MFNNPILHPGFFILVTAAAWLILVVLLIPLEKIINKDQFTTFKVISVIAVIVAVFSLCTWIFVPCNETVLDTKVDVDTKDITSVLQYTKVVNESGVTAITSNDGYLVISGDDYLYFYETPEGIREKKIPAKPDNTVIVYTEETPQVITTTTTTDYRKDWWLFYTEYYRTEEVKYEIYIPKGSLTT